MVDGDAQWQVEGDIVLVATNDSEEFELELSEVEVSLGQSKLEREE